MPGAAEGAAGGVSLVAMSPAADVGGRLYGRLKEVNIMRVLIATQLTNGNRERDYDNCVDGELVYMQEPCDTDRRDPDGGCGCGRGFAGMNSHRSTTTARVVESPLTEAEVREALRSSLEAGGWLNPQFCSAELAALMVEEHFAVLREVADHLPVDTVVRRKLDYYTPTFAEH